VREAGTGKKGRASSRLRWILILAEASLVLGLLGVVILSEEVSTSNSLWVLFLYSFPSEFLVGLVPHEPILIAFGETYPPWVVALVSVIGTVMAEGLNYSFFGLFYGIPSFRDVFERESVRKIADLFSRMPSSAILFAGFTPVPFFPVRFLVVITGYPVWKYLLAVFLSRGPRFFLLAMFGAFFDVPPLLLVGLFLVIFFVVNLPAGVKVLKDPRSELSGD
jgi:membrane protein YqaA with SNARE-associated domain